MKQNKIYDNRFRMCFILLYAIKFDSHTGTNYSCNIRPLALEYAAPQRQLIFQTHITRLLNKQIQCYLNRHWRLFVICVA